MASASCHTRCNDSRAFSTCSCPAEPFVPRDAPFGAPLAQTLCAVSDPGAIDTGGGGGAYVGGGIGDACGVLISCIVGALAGLCVGNVT
ncbi:MAG: hypothetical protein IPM54_33065 [Polyangiaceae bacterium]|nr:hypothetical protein [Polyangiaceae bacterium]